MVCTTQKPHTHTQTKTQTNKQTNKHTLKIAQVSFQCSATQLQDCPKPPESVNARAAREGSDGSVFSCHQSIVTSVLSPGLRKRKTLNVAQPA